MNDLTISLACDAVHNNIEHIAEHALRSFYLVKKEQILLTNISLGWNMVESVLLTDKVQSHI